MQNPLTETMDKDTGFDQIDSFSKVHHRDGKMTTREEIAMATVGDEHTKFEQERGVDAMTKIIAEGGRFQCVKKLGLNIKNTTQFYAQGKERDKWPFITFQNLYRTWAIHFNIANGKGSGQDNQLI